MAAIIDPHAIIHICGEIRQVSDALSCSGGQEYNFQLFVISPLLLTTEPEQLEPVFPAPPIRLASSQLPLIPETILVLLS